MFRAPWWPGLQLEVVQLPEGPGGLGVDLWLVHLPVL